MTNKSKDSKDSKEAKVSFEHYLITKRDLPFQRRDMLHHLLSSMFRARFTSPIERGRTGKVVAARHCAMYLLNTVYGYKPTKIAQLYARDRTTIVHGLHAAEDMRDDPEIDQVLTTIENFLTTTEAALEFKCVKSSNLSQRPTSEREGHGERHTSGDEPESNSDEVHLPD